MSAPLSNDLRWCIVWFVLGARKNTHETAMLLSVTQKTVFSILCRFRQYGHVRPCRIGRPNVMSALSREQAFILMEYIFHHSGLNIREALHYTETITGGQFNVLSLWRCLKWHNFMRKKVHNDSFFSV